MIGVGIRTRELVLHLELQICFDSSNIFCWKYTRNCMRPWMHPARLLCTYKYPHDILHPESPRVQCQNSAWQSQNLSKKCPAPHTVHTHYTVYSTGCADKWKRFHGWLISIPSQPETSFLLNTRTYVLYSTARTHMSRLYSTYVTPVRHIQHASFSLSCTAACSFFRAHFTETLQD